MVARSAYDSRSASMSCRASSSVPCNSWYAQRSATIPRVNSTLPAPTMVTLAIR